MNKNFENSAVRLRVVFDKLVELIRDEYRTIRTRNDKIPELDILEF